MMYVQCNTIPYQYSVRLSRLPKHASIQCFGRVHQLMVPALQDARVKVDQARARPRQAISDRPSLPVRHERRADVLLSHFPQLIR